MIRGVLGMIKLLGILGENGVPILIRASEDIIKKDAIVYLVSCLNAISSLISRGETKILDIENYKLLVLNSEKGYMIVGLSEGPIESSQILLQAIKEEIDKKNVPRFANIVTEKLEEIVSQIVNEQLVLFRSLRLLQRLPKDMERSMEKKEMREIISGDVIDYIFNDFPKNLIIVMRSIKNIYGSPIVRYLGKHIGGTIWRRMTGMIQPRSMIDLKNILAEFSVVGETTMDSISLLVCPECVARTSNTPMCIFMEGLIEGMFNNPRFQVKERKCLAMGKKECLFTLSKSP